MKPFHKMKVRDIIATPEFREAYRAEMRPIVTPGNGRGIDPVPAEEIADLMLRELGNSVAGKVLPHREQVSVSRGLTVIGHLIIKARKSEKNRENKAAKAKSN